MEAHYVFKLFNSIKDEHEIDLAELELKSLFGNVERVRNMFDILLKEPFFHFTADEIRIQDYATYELPYGNFHGFYGFEEELRDVTPLIRRLAYTREIYLAMKTQARPGALLIKIFPDGQIGRNVQYWVKGEYCLFRFITHQYFLEKSEYVHKVSRSEAEVDRNIEILTKFPVNEIYRIPASATMRVGKRLQDYFAIREEESLYLTHYMHPYKGKFHAKMCRAILNYVHPHSNGKVMDNFAGSGTLLVEASLMGIDSVGVEINPLSSLMSNVKCFSLQLDYENLKEEAYNYLKTYQEELAKQSDAKQITLTPLKVDRHQVIREMANLPEFIMEKLDKETVHRIIIAKRLLSEIEDEAIRQFMLLTLSGAISDAVRRRRADFLTIFEERLKDLLLRVYIFKKLNETLKIKLGNSVTFSSDARNMKEIEDESIDAIVTSPPYSTAINYVENDKFQLVLLDFASPEALAKEMIGHPDLKVYDKRLLYELNTENLKEQPLHLQRVISDLLKYGRFDAALRTYKFHKDMSKALKEMHRVLKKGCKCAIIIGNNNYEAGVKVVEVKNDEILIEMGKNIGFTSDVYLNRPLEKTSTGAIRYESIVILKK
jgi:site-specific DNA-methyltransferase (cytosine-N4-specific)